MKKLWSLTTFVLLVIFGILSSPAAAGPIPQGDTQVSPLSKLNIEMGIQYRVMYNYSNIPLTGVTSFTDADSYDFFRQRLRLNIDLKPTDNAGGFLQMEFRGGWGGSSPDFSDPRDEAPTVNPFNRLQARGIRYGYLYVMPTENRVLAVGILPASDQVGDTLFSADWDFNVGGIAYVAKKGRVDYRLAYLRLVDTVNSSVNADLTRDGNIYVGDLNFKLNEVRVGVHAYYLYLGKVADQTGPSPPPPGGLQEGWYGLTASAPLGPVALNGFAIVNTGFSDSTRQHHTGFAVKGEGSFSLGQARASLLAIYTTGDKPGDVDSRFVTVQEIVGTQGYWAYTHLFTANGPSDVNDLGVRIDNGGRGLLTVQGKLSGPIVKRLSGDLIAGYFRSARDNAAAKHYMGTEVAGMLTLEVAKNLNLQAGAAGGFMGDFFATGADNLYEVFSRFQLQF